MKPVTFSGNAIKQLDDWRKSDPKLLVKIITLITEVASTPFTGSGKPEPLKHTL